MWITLQSTRAQSCWRRPERLRRTDFREKIEEQPIKSRKKTGKNGVKEAKEEENFKTDHSIKLNRFGKKGKVPQCLKWASMGSLIIEAKAFSVV